MEYEFYEESPGKSPITREIEAQDGLTQRVILKRLEDLTKLDLFSLFKNKTIKKLKGRNPYKLHELRFNAKDKIARLFFVFCEAKAIILHLFIKKTNETPKREIKTAEQRAQTLESIKKQKNEFI